MVNNSLIVRNCLIKSFPIGKGHEAPFVAWLCSNFHMRRLPMRINVRYYTVYALPVLTIKEVRVYAVEDGNTNQCGA